MCNIQFEEILSKDKGTHVCVQYGISCTFTQEGGGGEVVRLECMSQAFDILTVPEVLNGRCKHAELMKTETTASNPGVVVVVVVVCKLVVVAVATERQWQWQ